MPNQQPPHQTQPQQPPAPPMPQPHGQSQSPISSTPTPTSQTQPPGTSGPSSTTPPQQKPGPGGVPPNASTQALMTMQQKQNRIAPVSKPAGLDPIELLNERENRYNFCVYHLTYLFLTVTYLLLLSN